MPLPSHSDASDSTAPSSPRGMGADFSDAEEAQNIYFPTTLRSRQTSAKGIWEDLKRKQQIEERFEQLALDAPESDSGGSHTAPSRLVNVALEGMVPVMMRESTGGDVDAGGSGTAEVEIQMERPLPPSKTVTTTTDPVVKVSWGPDNHVLASGEAMKIVKSLRKKERQEIKKEVKRALPKEKVVMVEENESQPAKAFPKDLLIDGIVEVMSEQKVWDLIDIRMRVDRPESDILQALEEVAFVWQTGGLLGKWELKPEFKKPSAELGNWVAEAKAHFAHQKASADTSEQDHDARWDVQSAIKYGRLPMPPPGTPRPEPSDATHDGNQAILKHSLSTPTLPAFHSISDPALVAAYMVERANDPVAFDKKTAGIKGSLTAAKIRRRGSNFLTQGDYTVELASREDAAKVEKWKHGEKILQGIDENEVRCQEERDLRTNKVRKRKQTRRRPKERGVHRSITPTDLGNFELSENVCKYTTSGALRQQCSRQVEDDESGKKTTYTTWIEIKQEVLVPTIKDVGWVDVREAMKQVKARKKDERREETVEQASREDGDGKGLDGKKHIGQQSSKHGNADESLSPSGSEDHDGWCPERRSQKMRRAENETEKAMEDKGAEDAGREWGRNPVDAAQMVGELVTAIDNLRDGKAEASTNFRDAISKQMLEVAKLLNQSAESGTDRPAGDVVEG